MNKIKQILLPGLNKQLKFLESKLELSNLNILVVGSGSTAIANKLSQSNNVVLIMEDFESLMSAKMEVDNQSNISIKLMDFERTDFSPNTFDLVYAQGSVSDTRRNKIIKEIKRITKTDAHYCIGELIKLKKNVPIFVSEIFDNSNLDPLDETDLIKYYQDRNFEIMESLDLSETLSDYYREYLKLLDQKHSSLSSSEKSYYKKVLSKIKHESNAYLKLGADQFIGFRVLLLKKNK